MDGWMLFGSTITGFKVSSFDKICLLLFKPLFSVHLFESSIFLKQ